MYVTLTLAAYLHQSVIAVALHFITFHHLLFTDSSDKHPSICSFGLYYSSHYQKHFYLKCMKSTFLKYESIKLTLNLTEFNLTTN